MAKDGGLIKAIAIGLGCGLVITGGCYVALNFDKIFNKQEQVTPAPDVPDVPSTPDEPDNPIVLTHKVTFIYGGETEVQTVATGGFPEYVLIATTGDVRFLGWFEGETLIEDPFSVAVTRDIVYEAKYEVIEFVEVKLVVNGEEITQNIELGQIIEEPEAPTKEGYTFLGWSADDGETFIDFETFTLSADTTITAIFEINEYTLTLNVDGTTTTQTIEHGQTLTLDNPSKEGYTFKNWLIDGQAVDLTNYVVTGDVTLTAEFEINTYTVTLNIDGTTTTQTIEHGKTLTLEEPQKQGYTFINWTLNGEVIDLTTYTVTEDITLVAVFDKSVTSASLFTFDNGTLTGYTGTDTDLTIPSTYSLNASGNVIDGEDIAVTTIASSAFKSKTSIISIAIPASVTSIGSSAFDGCTGLTSVTFEDGLKTIGNRAFYNCSGLTNLVLPDTVTSIVQGAFANNTNLLTVKLPAGLKTLTQAVFSNCTKLTTAEIPKSITVIEKNAFSKCSALTGITIPDGVTTIGESAFYQCKKISSITIPDSVTSLGASAFEGCSSGLRTVVIGNGLKSIPEKAFYECYYIRSLTLGNSIETIGNNAFDGEYVTTLTIPNSVVSIGDYAFGGFKRLTTINWGTSGNLRTIGLGAFTSTEALKSVVIPEGVTSIGEKAFQYSALNTVSIPSTVTSIGANAFYQLSYGSNKVTEMIIYSTAFPTITADFIPNTTCTVYVVDELLETYKTNEYLSTHADQFVAINEGEDEPPEFE